MADVPESPETPEEGADPAGPERRHRRPVMLASIAVGAVVAFLLVVFGLSHVGGKDSAATPLLGQAAPPITGQTLTGGSFDLSSRRGSWVVLNFFASWCDPCKQEAPELARFAAAEQAKGTDGAELIGVVYNDSASAIQDFLKTYGSGQTFPVVLDPNGSSAISYGVVKVPETWIVDPDGIVRARVITAVSADDLATLLAKVQGTA
jgi:cytochrome c biogenesis protein CcmG/thiol:disulfide interchange protein DsbE